MSKTDYKLARTCPTKLYYRESGYPDNSSDAPYLQLLAEGGYMVEALAKARYPSGVTLSYGSDPEADFEQTARALEAGEVTLFEATLLVGRRLARVDILEKHGDTVRLIEVKAKSFDSTEHRASLASGKKRTFGASKWRGYLEDITYQTILLERAFPRIHVEPRLLLVDKAKHAELDGAPTLFELVRTERADGTSRLVTARYTGSRDMLDRLDLLVELDVTAEVDALRESVEEHAAEFEASLAPTLRRLPPTLQARCRDCEFRQSTRNPKDGFRECWGAMADTEPHVLDLYKGSMVKGAGGGQLVAELAASGQASLLAVPEHLLAKQDGTIGPQSERQRTQIRHSRSNTAWQAPLVAEQISRALYPLHFIDFEASRLAIPYHSGMRPYGLVAFQWSCHTIETLGARPRHSDWLNNTDLWPNADFARSLRTAIGDNGTILTWSHFEATTMGEIARDLRVWAPEETALADWLIRTSDGGRLLDLYQLCLRGYFHPRMRGSTSIKAVLNALWPSDPGMRAQCSEWTGRDGTPDAGPYAALPPVQIQGAAQEVHEGTGAMRAYQEMMYGLDRVNETARAQWAQLLRQYCELDTLAMVLVWEHWRRSAGLTT